MCQPPISKYCPLWLLLHGFVQFHIGERHLPHVPYKLWAQDTCVPLLHMFEAWWYTTSLTSQLIRQQVGRGGISSMWDSKWCDVKGYKAKTLGPKIRPSEEPIEHIHNNCYVYSWFFFSKYINQIFYVPYVYTW